MYLNLLSVHQFNACLSLCVKNHFAWPLRFESAVPVHFTCAFAVSEIQKKIVLKWQNLVASRCSASVAVVKKRKEKSIVCRRR